MEQLFLIRIMVSILRFNKNFKIFNSKIFKYVESKIFK
jgi:hypothetical protein